VHLSVYSPPFGGILPSRNATIELHRLRQFEHYAFVVRELARLTMPGRMTAVHCGREAGNCGTDA
jgi:hypothetical protein